MSDPIEHFFLSERQVEIWPEAVIPAQPLGDNQLYEIGFIKQAHYAVHAGSRSQLRWPCGTRAHLAGKRAQPIWMQINRP